jgi:hypothetical protein
LRNSRWGSVDFKTSLDRHCEKRKVKAAHTVKTFYLRRIRRFDGCARGARRSVRKELRGHRAADFGIKVQAHMLCHAYGYKLTNQGHDTRAIQCQNGCPTRPRTAQLRLLAYGKLRNGRSALLQRALWRYVGR